MEHLIKDLMEQLSNRKKNEMAWFEKYKNEELRDLMMVSSGKIMEMDHVIREMKQMIKYKLKSKNYSQ
ncbi:MAG: hypothetical protein Q8P34_00195 [Bacteroidota bacterium]|nr:hypothetical protein [Bacteroidota bacterium]